MASSKVLQSILLVCLATAGCGPRVDNVNAQKELDDRAALTETYNKISNTYRGLLTSRIDGSDPIMIELEIYTAEEQNGVNESGELKLRPTLRARYRDLSSQMDISSERTLHLRYYRETGEVAGVSASSSVVSGVPDAGFLSISGMLSSEKVLTIEIRDHRGILGTAVLRPSK